MVSFTAKLTKSKRYNWLIFDIIEKAVSCLTQYAKGKLLDVGCGEKPYLNIFSSYVNLYIGMEYLKTPNKTWAVDIFGDALELPFKDKTFDTIASFQVLEHIIEPTHALSETFRVLRDEGHLLLTTPFMHGLHNEPEDYYRYTKYGLKYLLEKSGFEIIEIKPYCGYWATTGLRFCYYLKRFRVFRKHPFIPIFLIVQLLARLLDRLSFVDTDAGGYICVARKPNE